MPFEGNGWNPAQVITSGELLQLAKSKYMVEKMEDKPHSTSQKYKIPGHAGTFAFIPTMSQPFCGDCNRLRLTADGKIKNCLFGREELDLLGLLRSGGDVEARIRESISRKHARMGGQFPENSLDAQAGSVQNRSMIRIGG
jgi:cyclic pyranopterin phosphate synthase